MVEPGLRFRNSGLGFGPQDGAHAAPCAATEASSHLAAMLGCGRRNASAAARSAGLRGGSEEDLVRRHPPGAVTAKAMTSATSSAVMASCW